ncbi:MAG: GGDEF domain-containing protein, partial [Mycobacteriales bacterium]
SAVAASPLDAALLSSLAADHAAGLTVISATGPVPGASTLPASLARMVAESVRAGRTDAGPLQLAALRLPTTSGVLVAASVPATGSGVLYLALAGGDLVLLLAAAATGAVLARVAARPLTELEAAAARVAAGDLSVQMPVRGRGEVARLGRSFNAMTGELRSSIHALQSSRDELRRNLTRLGDTLTSTHDLGRILEVILDTGVASVRAQAGALLLTNASGSDLYLLVGRGLEGRLPSEVTTGGGSVRVRIGRGVVGQVAATGEALRVTVGDQPGQVQLAPDEPVARSLIAVPLRSAGRVTGVLCLYDRIAAPEFDEGDMETIRTFAGQAAVAIDNVLLHQEAQRLSVTDGLTGLWNYRYFTSALTREVERASRFQRPLALIMLDLDRFKRLNDVHGHQRGNSVLVEMADRVRSVVREVDTVARYGGEEIALLLPETDVPGGELLAERIWSVVRGRPFGMTGEQPLTVTTSLGLGVFPRHGQSAVALLRAADAAMYQAKAAGRDCWRVAVADLART